MSSTAVRIVVNGEEQQLPHRLVLAELLQRLGRDPRTVAVELNGEIVSRSCFAEQMLSEGDRLEVVQFVQGG